MKTKLEESAREWLENEGQMTDHINDYIDAFIAGAQWMQKDLLESASGGFEEWHKSQPAVKPWSRKQDSLDGWQAAKLSDQKIIQEKDEEINFLKTINERLEEARVCHLTSCDEKDKKISELEESLRIEMANHKELASVCGSYREDAEKYPRALKDINWLSVYLEPKERAVIRKFHGISEE
jgi:hypothetical protein